MNLLNLNTWHLKKQTTDKIICSWVRSHKEPKQSKAEEH
jgi:hypothetical protein